MNKFLLVALLTITAFASSLLLTPLAMTPWQHALGVAAAVALVVGLLLMRVAISKTSVAVENAAQLASNEEHPAIQKIAEAASRIAIGGATLSHFIDRLSQSLTEQVEHAGQIADRIATVESTTGELEQQATRAQSQVEASNSAIQKSDRLLSNVISQQRELSCLISNTSELLVRLKTQTESISEITVTINQLASQTNLLALNAAIEAARAGENGRGFAVVADEVRNLAHKTTQATQGIEQLLGEITEDSAASSSSMEKVCASGESMANLVNQVSELISRASADSVEAKAAMNTVHQIICEHQQTNSGIASNASNLHHSILHVETDMHDSSERVLQLTHVTEDIFSQLGSFKLDHRNRVVEDLAIAAAQRIGTMFEQAVANGDLKESALFDTNYQEIPGTNPKKYKTRFDDFTDHHLPEIQEPILKENTFIIYAGAVDKNGYFPTHNLRFSQPLTGDYEKDMAHNRTKRIFDDSTGSRCGSHTERFLLQTYKRDTGEVMHDLSAPIFVNGKHWGGFRIGYKAED